MPLLGVTNCGPATRERPLRMSLALSATRALRRTTSLAVPSLRARAVRPRLAMAASAAAAPAAAPPSVRAEYEKLSERLLEISSLAGISGLIGWDEQARGIEMSEVIFICLFQMRQWSFLRSLGATSPCTKLHR